ncbi:MAG TPA: peptidase domain-containing ABC transporter [Chryseosolibacter sp.]
MIWKKTLSSFPLYRQMDAMDCGPSCLRMIAAFYGRHYSLQDLRDRCFITREGVSLLGISHAAEEIGFRTIGAKVQLEKLYEAKLPCIVHWQQKHFVVVRKITRKKVYVADPASGLITYSIAEFKSAWISSNAHGIETGVVLLLEPTPAFFESSGATELTGWNQLRRLTRYFSGHGKLVSQMLLGLLTGSIIQLMFPFLTQSIVDVGINTRNIEFIYLVLIGQFFLFVSRFSVEIIRRWILLHLSTRINISIMSEFLIKLYRLPMQFFEGKKIGDILRRIEDNSRIERLLSTSSLNTIFSLFNLVVFGVVLIIYNVKIFAVFFGFSALYITYVLLFLKKRAELDYKKFQQMADHQSSLIQTVNGMCEIKLNNCETQKRWEWERIQAKLFQISVASNKLQQYQDVGSALLNESKNMIITMMSALAVIEGDMTLGTMMAVQYIIGQLNVPVNEFVAFSRDLQDAKLSLDRIAEIHALKEEESDDDNLGFIDVLPENKTIIIKNLSFQYDGPYSPKVLDRIDLIIPERKTTAIVGSSGSGKTTLLKLLLKFYKSQSGEITLGGVPLESIKASHLRNYCGTVLQDGYLFSDTIARNIALGQDRIDRSRLFHAVTVANIKEHIESLPLAYNTMVGSNGVGLSQGQKQRLLIARAVYKNPDFIFFDEATSALDANNEKTIIENLNQFFYGKTVLVIAHRLSTVKNADQIVVMDKGRIVEVGSHEQLTLSKGKYFNLVKNQLELGN